TGIRTLLVQINGESRQVRDRSTLDDLVSELSLAPTRIAVELNQQVVRRDKWAQTILADGDRIEIVHFVGGGDAESSRQEAGGSSCNAVERFLVSL
ncbi:MAG TPA: sulfur carrier protein ThiS, partial [Pyrinomonadaceae bacterium]